MIIKEMYHQLRLALPQSLKERLKEFGLDRIFARIDPRRDPDHVFVFRSGPLAGVRFRITEDEKYYVDGGIYEPEVCRAISSLMIPGMTAADVGAHLGYFSLLMANLVGRQGRVVSFEASPRNSVLLRENVRVNDLLDRVTVENIAVADGVAAQVTLYDGASSSQCSLSGMKDRALCEMPAVSLDAYFGEQRLDLVKIDVEGAECAVMDGMKGILGAQRPSIVMEVHGSGCWGAVGALARTGYRISDLNGKELSPSTWPGGDRPLHICATPAMRSEVSSAIAK